MVLGLAKLLFLSLGQLPLTQAAPILVQQWFSAAEEPDPKSPGDPSLWIYLSFAAVLVLLGGAFAGLTIALMGQVSGKGYAERDRILITCCRMSYTFKLYKTLAKERRECMQPKFSTCYAKASIGFS